MSSPNFQTVAPSSSATPEPELNRLLTTLSQKKAEWVALSTYQRAELLDKCIASTLGIAEEWVRAACQAKGLDFGQANSGEEWLAGPMVTIRNLRLLRDAMEAEGAPAVRGIRAVENKSGKPSQLAVNVFPTSTLDSILYSGFSAEVWLEPGKPASQGEIYRKPKNARGDGKVALVLGAGNQSSIGPMDALYKLFVENEVVLLKTNPVNEYLKPFWEEAFRPLLERGFYFVVRGGAETGAYLVNHPLVDTVHITGSDRTHDAIVWGASPDEQRSNKEKGTPRLKKPISSELGAVTPIIIVPGNWTQRDIERQAWHVASMVANNGSFNCNAAKVVVTQRSWPQRAAFLKALEQRLTDFPQKKAYYPGAQDRYDGFLRQYPNAKPLGKSRSANIVPWTLLPDVPAKKGEYALTTEAFCGVLADCALDAASVPEFLEKAVDFANDSCWGTLSCGIFIDPKTESSYKKEFENAIANLRYGGIGVNAWPAVVYGLASTTWGAFPGHPLQQIESGRGVVHNTYMLDHPQKSVVRIPFRPYPRPVWFTGHPTVHELGKLLCEMEASPSYFKLPAIIGRALRG